MQPKVAAFSKMLRGLEAFRLAQPAWLPYRLFLRLAEHRAASTLLPALRESDGQMLARLEGLAAGAGLPLRNLCLVNAMEAFLSMTEGIVAPPGCCSAVAVRGVRTPDREPILARNFDYLPEVEPFFILRESRPREGFRSLEFTTILHAGAIDGINEKGLSIVQNYAFVTDSGRPAPLISMLTAATLAACGSVAEATAFIARRRWWGAGILTLADAAGDIAILELSNTRSAIRRLAFNEDWLLATNVCLSPEICPVQVPDTFIYSNRAPRALRGMRVLDWHAERARRLQELIEAQSAVGPAELAAMMADHGPDGIPGGASPCVHTPYWRTTASLQWFPARRCVRVSYGAACAADYVEITL